MNDDFNFDKFIQDIVVREEAQRKVIEEHQEGQDILPQRVYNRRYREHWQNRIRWQDTK